MSIAELLAVLVRQPFSLTIEQALGLDRWTIQHIYFRRRDKNGNLVIKKKSKKKQAEPMTFKEMFFYQRVVKWNVPKDKAERLWQEYVNASQPVKRSGSSGRNLPGSKSAAGSRLATSG